jgi:DNA-directed RNA polymerase specialized sigma24 family protein
MPNQPTFANCVAQHLPFLTRVVRSLMRGDQNAEDIVQQTVFKALTNADQSRFESSLKTWLVSIALNEARRPIRVDGADAPFRCWRRAWIRFDFLRVRATLIQGSQSLHQAIS